MADIISQFEMEERLGAQPGGHHQPLNPFDYQDPDVVAIHVNTVR